MLQRFAAGLLFRLTSPHAEAAAVCAREVNALSNADLRSLVDVASARREGADEYMAVGLLSFLAACLGHAALLRRLLMPAGFPLALAELVVSEEATSMPAKRAAVECFARVIEAARALDPPPDAWAKPLVKPLRQAFLRHGGDAALVSSATLAGFGLSWMIWRGHPAQEPAPLRALAAFAKRAWVDNAYRFIYRGGLLVVASWAAWVDRYIVDALMNACGALFIGGAQRARRIQTGNVRDYLFAVSLGALCLTAWGLWR